MDIACAVARIEQIATMDYDDPLREQLLDRLVTCDAPRLRGHLTTEALDALAEAAEPGYHDVGAASDDAPPRFDMLYWVFAARKPRERDRGFYAYTGPFYEQNLAERQAAAIKGYVVGVSVMFLADRTDGVERP